MIVFKHSRLVLSTVWVLAQLIFLDFAAASPRNPVFLVGIGTHLSRNGAPLDHALDMIAAAGVASIRDDVTWAQVERRPGVLNIPSRLDKLINGANARGIKPLLILDYGNRFYDGGDKPITQQAIRAFVRYAEFVADHFQGRVAYYEIWNEWDAGVGHTTPGSAKDYVNLVRAVYPALKIADPSAKVLVGAVASRGIRDGYLTHVVTQGVLDNADGLSLHTYVYFYEKSKPSDWADWMSAVEVQLQQITHRTVPLYITEMGWPTVTGSHGVSEATQAKYLTKVFVLARKLPFIRGIWWYDFRNDGTDPRDTEDNFGLVRRDWIIKPGYDALHAVTARGVDVSPAGAN